MIKLHEGETWLLNGILTREAVGRDAAQGRCETMAAQILRAHGGAADGGRLRVRFDGMISHDITYVGIIQTARASGMKTFPLPYALTNCHNSLCAVGGTINEDDHLFGLSAARRYGGRYVPANMAVIHQYARETMATCGGMLLGSDSHTRYGALGCMGVGEGGPELVKQLLGSTWDIAVPRVVLVHLTGAPRRGVGPHDVALALCAAVYQNGFVKNAVLEFDGPGIENLGMDFRIGIDVMTTETACLSSIWRTDERVKRWYARHGRPEDFRVIAPGSAACYDALIEIDLAQVEPMIALPYHPSNALPIRELCENPADILREVERAQKLPEGALTSHVQNGRVRLDQGVIAGCAGGMYDNIAEAAAILRDAPMDDGAFALSVYPPSVPVSLALMQSGIQSELTRAGALFKSCFCGPCFGAGDVPGHGCLSARHTTRNFPNREGSKPGEGQLALVALMDARSIAATAANGGLLTAADQIEYEAPAPCEYPFDASAYERRVYDGLGHPLPEEPLRMGPNIADWPAFGPLPKHIVLEVASVLKDAVTTTDELIPSGETSSYRSNPARLSEFALSRRDPGYVARAKAARDTGAQTLPGLIDASLVPDTGYASLIYAHRPGDGSAREQAASCQRVLGGRANICLEYATKRYRSNLINWGILPFTVDQDPDLHLGDRVLIEDVRAQVEKGADALMATVLGADGRDRPLLLRLEGLDAKDRRILLDGCLMNHYANERKAK